MEMLWTQQRQSALLPGTIRDDHQKAAQDDYSLYAGKSLLQCLSQHASSELLSSGRLQFSALKCIPFFPSLLQIQDEIQEACRQGPNFLPSVLSPFGFNNATCVAEFSRNALMNQGWRQVLSVCPGEKKVASSCPKYWVFSLGQHTGFGMKVYTGPVDIAVKGLKT